MKAPTSLAPLPTLQDILEAEKRIRPTLPVTPLTYSSALSEHCDREVFIKWDNKFKTGAYKERGVLNFLLTLSQEDQERGVCTASAGNNAMAVSYHASRLGIPATIVMPVIAATVKIERTRQYGAQVLLKGRNYNQAADFALQYCEEHGLRYLPAFDHPAIICGQGTSGLEILEQLEDIDAILVPMGGGGLASGIATVVKATQPHIQIIGVQSAWVQETQVEEGSSNDFGPLGEPATIAGGIAVKKLGSLPQRILEEKLDHRIFVSEQELADAIVLSLHTEHVVLEGAGAAALAALISGKIPKELKRVVLVACGSNIDITVLSRLIDRELSQRGRLIRLRVSVPDRPGSLAYLTRIIAEENVNIRETQHDRSIALRPCDVVVSFLLEIQNPEHGEQLKNALKKEGFQLLDP